MYLKFPRIDSALRSSCITALATGLAMLLAFASHAGPTVSPTATPTATPTFSPFPDHCEIDIKCSVNGEAPRDDFCFFVGIGDVTLHYDFIGGTAEIIDDILGVIGIYQGTTLTRTITVSESNTHTATFNSIEAVCLNGIFSDSVSYVHGAPTPTAAPTATPTFTPTATPTATPTSPFPEDCHPICEVDKKCSVGGSAPQDSCVASVGEEVTYTYDVHSGPVGVVFEVRDDKLGVIGQTSGERLTRTTTLTQTTTNTASVSVYYPDVCFCLGDTPDSVTVTVATPTPTATPTATPTPAPFDCLCEVTNINPNSLNLNKVSTGGKQSSITRRMNVQIRAVDAPGATCDAGETSGPVEINLKMVDDDGQVLIDSAKIAVCEGGGGQKQMVRNVFVQPKNCKDSAVPVGTSSGVITATGSSSSFGVSDHVELLTINCNE